MKHLKIFEEFDDDEDFEEYHDINEFENDYDIDTAVDSYITALIWTEEGHETDYDPWEGKNIYDIDENSKDEIVKEVEWFINSAGDVFEDMTDDQIGNDLWLTRNGHGSGFFERINDSENLTIITKLCDVLGNVDAEIGDDGNIYHHSNDKYKTFNVDEYKKKIEFDKTVNKFNL